MRCTSQLPPDGKRPHRPPPVCAAKGGGGNLWFNRSLPQQIRGQGAACESENNAESLSLRGRRSFASSARTLISVLSRKARSETAKCSDFENDGTGGRTAESRTETAQLTTLRNTMCRRVGCELAYFASVHSVRDNKTRVESPRPSRNDSAHERTEL